MDTKKFAAKPLHINFVFLLVSILACAVQGCTPKPDGARGAANSDTRPSANGAPAGNSTPISAPGNLTGTYVYKRGGFNNEFRVQELGGGKLKLMFLGNYEYKDSAGEWMVNSSGTPPTEVSLDGSRAVLRVEDYPDCRIALEFSGGRLRVEQENACGFAHNVVASGIYKKAEGDPPRFDGPFLLRDGSPVEAASDGHRRIRFERGKSAAIVAGRIRGKEDVVYLFDARAGQTAELEVTSDSPTNDVVFYLEAPDGSHPMGEGADGYDTSWKGKLPATGTYKITVGTIETEAADFQLTVSIR